jgi:hypothetical protein
LNQQLIFFVYIASISLASGPTLSITSWFSMFQPILASASGSYKNETTFRLPNMNEYQTLMQYINATFTRGTKFEELR